ncbi:hypothetical protein ECG_02033 [Echinococcus granulosus]|nr:hypothetical protein ECG_02033 [Echinococcus granulosus]
MMASNDLEVTAAQLEMQLLLPSCTSTSYTASGGGSDVDALWQGAPTGPTTQLRVVSLTFCPFRCSHMEDVLPSSLVPLTYLLAGERLSVVSGSKEGPHSVASRLLPLPPPLPPSRPKSSLQLLLTLTSKSNTTTLTPLLPVPEWQALPPSSIPAPTAQFALPHIAIVTPCSFISSLQGSAFTQPFLSKCEVTGGAKSKCGADGPREARTDAVPREDGVERARRDGELEEEENIEEFCTAGTALHSSSEAEIITGHFFFPVTNP